MQSTWWADLSDLDTQQEAFLGLSEDGKHILTGPPGSGKTNLLLLRAKYLHGMGYKNILILTFNRSLRDFIRSGIDPNRFFDPLLVRTYWSWAREHLRTYNQDASDDLANISDFSRARTALEKALAVANANVGISPYYDAIFVDEAQDLSREEIAILSALSDKVMITGDSRQSLYGKDGLQTLEFTPFELKFHYRIGKKICDVADKLLPAQAGKPSLADNCNYREDLLASSADLHKCDSIENQLQRMCSSVSNQLRAYRGENIGIIVAKNVNIEPVKEALIQAGHEGILAVYGSNISDAGFGADKRIHLMTIYNAKGAEFRAVHFPLCEDLKFPQVKRELFFTAVTRAKTSLSVYYTGKILRPIESAFATRTVPRIDDLF